MGCRGSLSRRAFLAGAAHSIGAAALGPSLFSLLARDAMARGGPKARKLVLLWLEGGPSQMDTFDPKPGSPNGGGLKGLATDINGWWFSDHLPELANRAGDLAVIRSMTSKEGNHSRARLLVKTGYVPNPSVSFPSIGAIVASELGDPDFELPGYVQVNGAPSPSGYLGIENAPFVIKDPAKKIENLDYAAQVDAQRLNRRRDLLEVLEGEFERRGGDQPVQSNRTLRKRARRLMDTRLRSAFDLDLEKHATRERYGLGKFGQGCLLARRLLETGVSAVEVVLDGWDTHQDNANRTKKLCSELDPAFSALIDDLKQSGLHAETVVACMGEFGRTPRLDGDGRNHWPGNWCVALSGAGIPGGTVRGTTDADGLKIIDAPVTVTDLFATLAHTLGIDGTKERFVRDRPVTLIDKEGRAIDWKASLESGEK